MNEDAMIDFCNAKMAVLAKDYINAFKMHDKSKMSCARHKIEKYSGLLLFDGTVDEFISMLENNA